MSACKQMFCMGTHNVISCFAEKTVNKVARSECTCWGVQRSFGMPSGEKESPVTSGATNFPLGAFSRTWSPTCKNTSEWPILTSASSQKFECAEKSSRVCSYPRTGIISNTLDVNQLVNLHLDLATDRPHTNHPFGSYCGVASQVVYTFQMCASQQQN
jgi:hypothetical protein